MIPVMTARFGMAESGCFKVTKRKIVVARAREGQGDQSDRTRVLDCLTASFQRVGSPSPAVFMRRTLSFVGGLCCALLLWSAFSANPVCAVLLLILAAIAFADPVAGLMLVLAAESCRDGGGRDLLGHARRLGRDGGGRRRARLAAARGGARRLLPARHERPGRAALSPASASLALVQLAALATQISPGLLAADLAGEPATLRHRAQPLGAGGQAGRAAARRTARLHCGRHANERPARTAACCACSRSAPAAPRS